MAGDLADDTLQILLTEEFAAGDMLMHETLANGSSAHNIVRHSGARKYNQEDALEAAAAEMILQKNV